MDEGEVFQELAMECVNMLIHVGLINSVIGQYPLDVQDNWRERLEGYSHWLREQQAEIQAFGEVFDEPHHPDSVE